MEDARAHLKTHPNDVCMVRCQASVGENSKIVLMGGPIPEGTLVDVTDHDFRYIADSFDVGEMTSLVEQ